MRLLTFSNRNAKEILRDPLTVAFGLGFPLILIILLSAIQANIPVPLFEIQHLAPGIDALDDVILQLFEYLVCQGNALVIFHGCASLLHLVAAGS